MRFKVLICQLKFTHLLLGSSEVFVQQHGVDAVHFHLGNLGGSLAIWISNGIFQRRKLSLQLSNNVLRIGVLRNPQFGLFNLVSFVVVIEVLLQVLVIRVVVGPFFGVLFTLKTLSRLLCKYFIQKLLLDFSFDALDHHFHRLQGNVEVTVPGRRFSHRKYFTIFLMMANPSRSNAVLTLTL